MFGFGKTVGDALINAWYGLWVLIDSLIYTLISISYQLFNLIAKASLYNTENAEIATIVDRISIILGIGMLFVLAYNIILNIMNPDKISAGGDKSMQGILKNAVIAIVMLTAYSTVFTYMNKIQNDIIDSQVIENIILGTDDSSSEIKNNNMGSKVATKIFIAFYYPIDSDGNYIDCDSSDEKICSTYKDGVTAAMNGNISALISNSKLFDKVKSDPPGIKYMYIISSICGVVALLMFISYVIDIGIRVAKMAFLQIIAPIPIMAYITKPNGGVFSKWLDNLIKTYLSLFMRLITIYFAMFLISLLTGTVGNSISGVFANSQGVSGGIKLLGNVVLIIGVLLFAKDAPKLLENLIGNTFDGSFSPKSIAKKLSGVRDVPGIGGAIGKGLDKANQGIGAAAGWYGARRAAIRNNKRLEKLQKAGKDTGNLTHMDVNAAAMQGRHNGYKNGGIGQAKAQGESVFAETYGYGKKQGLNGGFSRATLADEKYAKMYEKNVKAHAKARNDEIRNKAIGNEIPAEGDVASTRMKSTDYMKQNEDFRNNSQIYKNAAAEIDREQQTKGITYSPEEYKAKINEKLSQISATTSNANEKRAIDSYLSRESVISEYNSSVLSGNKDAIDKVKIEAKNKTEAIVKAEIESKGGIKTIVSNPAIKAQLEQKVTERINAEVKSSFTPEMEQKIRDSVANISFTNAADAENYIQGKITKEKEQMATKIRGESGDKYYDDAVQSYAKDLETDMFNAKIGEVETRTMAEAKEAAANKITEGIMNYEEGRIRGDHTNNADGSLDKVYNAEYATNETISNDGVKTKSAEDLAWDKIKKAVLDKDKK